MREESKESDMFGSKLKNILEKFKEFISGNK